MGILFPNPEEFHISVSAGYASLGAALVVDTCSISLWRDKLRTLVLINDTDDDDA